MRARTHNLFWGVQRFQLAQGGDLRRDRPCEAVPCKMPENDKFVDQIVFGGGIRQSDTGRRVQTALKSGQEWCREGCLTQDLCRNSETMAFYFLYEFPNKSTYRLARLPRQVLMSDSTDAINPPLLEHVSPDIVLHTA